MATRYHRRPPSSAEETFRNPTVTVRLLRYDEASPPIDAAGAFLTGPDRAHLTGAPRHRLERLLARALLRCSLGAVTGCPPATWVFGIAASGRPELTGSPVGPIAFSVSHTRGLVACAVAPGERAVGVDCERRGRPFDFPSLARTWFAPAEVQTLSASPGDCERRFLELWTLKESYAKARGLGLDLPLDTAVFEGPAATFPGGGDDPARWSFLRPIVSDGHVLAAAASRDAGGEVRWCVREVDLKTACQGRRAS